MAGLTCGVRRGVHVEPRLVHSQHRVPRNRQALWRRVAQLAVVDPERLLDRVRRAARAGRPLGGRVRTQAHVPARARGVRARQHRMRAGALGGRADRGPRRAGGGRRPDAADLARLDAAGVRPARAPHGDRRVGRHRRDRRGGGTAARRRARAGRLALGVPGECPDRIGRFGVWLAHADRAARARRATPGRAGRRSC